jgi:GDP-L-fucose synthase
MDKTSKIYIAGHRGLVGSAITRKLIAEGFHNLVVRTSSELDLRDYHNVFEFFNEQKFDYVFLAAAKVGGIIANQDFPVEFLRDNLWIQTNVIDAAYRTGVKKLMFLGSTCIYPKLAPQPLKEEYLLTGELEPTNEPYAVAKIAGIRLCQSYNRQYGSRFISVMPTNIYGQNDNYDLHSSHVMPALIRKFHEAKEQKSPYVEIWGSGKPKREFLHADDLADACLYLMEHYESSDIVNVGVGEDISIQELAEKIKQVIGYEGLINYDPSKPDGTPRKLVDVTRINQLGWLATIPLEVGLQMTYDWYLQNQIYTEDSIVQQVI